MNRESMRKQMEDVRGELNRIDEQKVALELLLKGYEAWFKANPEDAVKLSHAQFSLPHLGKGGGPRGSLSFKNGVVEVLKQARGAELTEDEIWRRMQEMGVRSEAKRPTGFIGLTAKRVPEIQKVAVKTWRWKVPSNPTNPNNGVAHQVLTDTPLERR